MDTNPRTPGEPGPAAPAPEPATALFDVPRDRLGSRLHGAVFGSLLPSLGRACDTPEVAAAIRPLLERGWRPAQLAARIGALPQPPGDPEPAVVAFLGQLLERSSPQESCELDRAERAREQAARDAEQAAGPPPATDEERAHWVAQARRSLGLPPQRRTPVAPPAQRRCAACQGEGTFFVTREVRLCEGCVGALASGHARLAVGA